MSSVDYSAVRSWRITELTGIEQLHQASLPIAPPKRGQLAVRIHAVSLNYRDLITVQGKYPGQQRPVEGGLIPCSDGAGEVVEVGEDVSEFNVGDRVATAFYQHWIAGPPPADLGTTTLGGAGVQGTLTTIGVFEADGLVHIPDSLSYEEAATLPCAAVTAWSALYDSRVPVGSASTVLVQGTGSVSLFATQIAVAAGARVIATSSSAEKLRTFEKLGVRPADLINYKATPDWHEEVKKRVPAGVDYVVEVTGQLSKSLQSIKLGGDIAVVGFLQGAENISVMDILMTGVNLRNMLVGSRLSFEKLLAAMEHNHVKPIIAKRFSFEHAADAFKHLEGQQSVGKVVITVEN